LFTLRRRGVKGPKGSHAKQEEKEGEKTFALADDWKKDFSCLAQSAKREKFVPKKKKSKLEPNPSPREQGKRYTP